MGNGAAGASAAAATGVGANLPRAGADTSAGTGVCHT